MYAAQSGGAVVVGHQPCRNRRRGGRFPVGPFRTACTVRDKVQADMRTPRHRSVITYSDACAVDLPKMFRLEMLLI